MMAIFRVVFDGWDWAKMNTIPMGRDYTAGHLIRVP